jgi:hypothetical protein
VSRTTKKYQKLEEDRRMVDLGNKVWMKND